MFRRKCFNQFARLHAVALGGIVFTTFLILSLAAAEDPLVDLKNGVAAYEGGRYSEALALLNPLAPRLSRLADYVAWFRASAQFDSRDYGNVAAALEPVWAQKPPSPFTGKAALLVARSLEKTNRPRDAAAVLQKYSRRLAQPQGDLEMAKALLAAGDGTNAAVSAQRVFFGYPTTPESAEAQLLMTALQTDLAERYPPVLGSTQLARIQKLLDARDAPHARRELVALEPQLMGAEREAARVKIGVADFIARRTYAAKKYLAALEVQSPAADAERLYYLFLCARRENDRGTADTFLAELTRLYPSSPLRMEALLTVANGYLIDNRVSDYEPLYRACYESFPREAKSALCHWKVTWVHYLQRQPDAATFLLEHVQRYPNSAETAAALYYLARLAESDGANGRAAAAAYYREIARRYANFFYGVLARQRLEEAGNNPVNAIPPAIFREAAFTPRPQAHDFEPNTTAQLRIERARMLAAAGLDGWWEAELRFAADTEDQPQAIALELARMLTRKGAPDQALRILKHYVPDYLWLTTDAGPREFWRIAFPIPYRADLEKYAKENNADIYLLAALIRQESEFDPKAVSSASARGLMQIMPSTGRELSRRLRVPYTLASLFQPQVNMRLGTFYLKDIADKLDGRWEAALAAYNAGLSRANQWSGWGEFREPSEFVESVPFTQTRDYIQIILRNADIYRRLYAGQPTPDDPPVQVSYSSDDKVSSVKAVQTVRSAEVKAASARPAGAAKTGTLRQGKSGAANTARKPRAVR